MMQRKPGFPVSNCSIKMPDCMSVMEPTCEEDGDQQQRRQQLINFGHAQWGFNNWNWAVTKQELDFVDLTNGKYCAGVVAFVSISVKNIDIHRENIGYATSLANNKGFAIYKSRKVAVTNALRETLLSFGGAVATELSELLETSKDIVTEPLTENNQDIANTNLAATNLVTTNLAATNLAATNLTATNIVNTNLAATNLVTTNLVNTNRTSNHTKPLLEGSPLVKNLRKDSIDTPLVNVSVPVKNVAPIAKTHPMPAAAVPLPRVPANQRPPPTIHPVQPRPNSNDPAKFEGMTEEETRAERKRRQRLAQEEFRLKQLVKQGPVDEKQDGSMRTLEHLLMEIPTQDIVIEETGASKRKSPALDVSAKRRAGVSKLDILHD